MPPPAHQRQPAAAARVRTPSPRRAGLPGTEVAQQQAPNRTAPTRLVHASGAGASRDLHHSRRSAGAERSCFARGLRENLAMASRLARGLSSTGRTSHSSPRCCSPRNPRSRNPPKALHADRPGAYMQEVEGRWCTASGTTPSCAARRAARLPGQLRVALRRPALRRGRRQRRARGAVRVRRQRVATRARLRDVRARSRQTRRGSPRCCARRSGCTRCTRCFFNDCWAILLLYAAVLAFGHRR